MRKLLLQIQSLFEDKMFWHIKDIKMLLSFPVLKSNEKMSFKCSKQEITTLLQRIFVPERKCVLCSLKKFLRFVKHNPVKLQFQCYSYMNKCVFALTDSSPVCAEMIVC